MELRQIRYFVALAEHLSFTAAAMSVHVCQSTLSHQIKNLETELGCQLFDRNSRVVQITEDGSTFLRHALRVLEEFDEGLRSLSAETPRLSGKIRIGVISTVHIGLVGNFTRALLSQFAELTLEIVEMSGDELRDNLLRDDIHLGIGYAVRDMAFEPLYRDELVLAVGHKHPLARRKRIRLAELHGQRLGLLSSGETRQIFFDYLAASKGKPLIVAEFNKIPMLLLLASISDIGVIAPRRSVEVFSNLNVIALESPVPVLQLGLMWPHAAQTDVQAKIAAAIRRLVKDPPSIRFEQLGVKGLD